MNDYTFITRRYILDFFTKNHEKIKRIEQYGMVFGERLYFYNKKVYFRFFYKKSRKNQTNRTIWDGLETHSKAQEAQRQTE
nr:MAG TPA: hypothetical protein [Microviridae sp.]